MDGLPTIAQLDDLAALLRRCPALYIRWSRGPDADGGSQSRDELTGAELPGLCANPLSVEEWWDDRPLRVWVARRLFDYEHLRNERGGDVRPWVLEGIELGRGPDNEPIVGDVRPVAWVAESVVEEAIAEVEAHSDEWGPLRRVRDDVPGEKAEGTS